jgi:hypothetical protein
MLVAQSANATNSDPNQLVHSECSLYLSADEPHGVLDMSSGFLDLFGFTTAELQRSLRRLSGPQTDMKGFNQFISNSCSHGEPSDISLTFYRKDGYEVHCRLQGGMSVFKGSKSIHLRFEKLDQRHGCCAWSADEDQFTSVPKPSDNGLELCPTDSGSFPEDSSSLHQIDRAVLLHMKYIERARKTEKLRSAAQR